MLTLFACIRIPQEPNGSPASAGSSGGWTTPPVAATGAPAAFADFSGAVQAPTAPPQAAAPPHQQPQQQQPQRPRSAGDASVHVTLGGSLVAKGFGAGGSSILASPTVVAIATPPRAASPAAAPAARSQPPPPPPLRAVASAGSPPIAAAASPLSSGYAAGLQWQQQPQSPQQQLEAHRFSTPSPPPVPRTWTPPRSAGNRMRTEDALQQELKEMGEEAGFEAGTIIVPASTVTGRGRRTGSCSSLKSLVGAAAAAGAALVVAGGGDAAPSRPTSVRNNLLEGSGAAGGGDGKVAANGSGGGGGAMHKLRERL